MDMFETYLVGETQARGAGLLLHVLIGLLFRAVALQVLIAVTAAALLGREGGLRLHAAWLPTSRRVLAFQLVLRRDHCLNLLDDVGDLRQLAWVQVLVAPLWRLRRLLRRLLRGLIAVRIFKNSHLLKSQLIALLLLLHHLI